MDVFQGAKDFFAFLVFCYQKSERGEEGFNVFISCEKEKLERRQIHSDSCSFDEFLKKKIIYRPDDSALAKKSQRKIKSRLS